MEKKKQIERLINLNIPLTADTVEVCSMEAAGDSEIILTIKVSGAVKIKSFAMNLYYDQTAFQYMSLEKSGTALENFSNVVGTPLAGKLNISGFAGSAPAVDGNQVFIKIKFKIISKSSVALKIEPADFLDDLAGAMGIPGTVRVEQSIVNLITVDHVRGRVGEIVLCKILIEKANNIKAFAFDLILDKPEIAEPIRLIKEGTLTSGYGNVNLIKKADESYHVAGFAGTGNSVNGDGPFLYIEYKLKMDGTTSFTIGNLIDDLQNATIQAGSITKLKRWHLY